MITPIITGRGPITGPIRRLQEEVRRLTPGRSVGTLTQVTSRGTTRNASPKNRNTNTDDTGARWA